jgi:hypothetical protein
MKKLQYRMNPPIRRSFSYPQSVVVYNFYPPWKYCYGYPGIYSHQRKSLPRVGPDKRTNVFGTQCGVKFLLTSLFIISDDVSRCASGMFRSKNCKNALITFTTPVCPHVTARQRTDFHYIWYCAVVTKLCCWSKSKGIKGGTITTQTSQGKISPSVTQQT